MNRFLLFKASEASWIAEAQKNKGIYVTDGPFPYRCADGTLLLLWSSMGEEGYTEAIAVSDNGDIDGNWVQRDELLFKKDGDRKSTRLNSSHPSSSRMPSSA